MQILFLFFGLPLLLFSFLSRRYWFFLAPEAVQNLALVTPLQKKEGTLVEDCITGARASHIQVTEKPNQDKVQVIPISCIIAKCVYIDVTDFADRSFVIPFPNRVEKD